MKAFLLLCFFWAASSQAAFLSKGDWDYWLRLLHYKKGQSLADGPDFFLSPEGKKNPEAELESTLKAFLDPEKKVGHFKLHPICAFPERFRFLKSLGLTQAEERHCDDFLFWKKGLQTKSLTLVFSTAFANDPSSMFGHTFIRFNQETENKNDLLDYGANYSAFINEENPNPFEYAYRGLFGGYRGYFDFAPYYMKVNEYINAESRDLYEYDLNISPERVEHLVNHLWEIYATTYFDYYFLDENCSFILADLLEVASPEWNLTDTGHFYYLPSDLIKKVREIPSAVTAIHYRPSLQKKFRESLKLLSKNEKKELSSLLKEKIMPRESTSFKALDSFILYAEVQRNSKRGKTSSKEQGLYREALLKRASFKEKSPEPILVSPETRLPEFSHEAQRLGLNYSHDKNAAWGFSYRMGPHNQMANDNGLDPFNHFEFLAFDGSYDLERKKLRLNQVQFLRLISLFPNKEFDSRLSWTVGAQIERIKEESCFNCQRLSLDGGGGVTFSLSEKNLFAFMSGLYSEYSSHYEKALRFGPYGEISLLGGPYLNLKYKFFSKIKADLFTKWKSHYAFEYGTVEALSLSRNTEIRFQGSWIGKYGSFDKQALEYKLDFAFYF